MGAGLDNVITRLGRDGISRTSSHLILRRVSRRRVSPIPVHVTSHGRST